MSQLIISSAQAAVSFLPTGTAAGGAQALASTLANAGAGYVLQQAQSLIFGPAKRRVEGPRLESFRLQASTEGAGVPVVYGRVRLAGQVVWASRFREEINTQTSGGGKGGRPSVQTTTTEYLYSISLAIGLCEGEVDRIGRVWADGKLISLQDYNWVLHCGGEMQMPDSTIEAVEGAGMAPAYRGLAYIVFEDLPLKDFGNRLPQFTFEVERVLRDENPAMLENAVNAVTMIPGSGETAYDTVPVVIDNGEGISRPENVHNNLGGTDFIASVDILSQTLPACGSVALVVSWFGTDLRAGFCEIMPGVEVRDKKTMPTEWSVNGLGRANAKLVSQLDDKPAYGGTPSDASVVAAIRHLKARGYKVLFYPFILMDIPPDNQLPNLDGGAGVQPAFPWRGRISAGVDNGSVAARVQIDSFFGSAQADDFNVVGEKVSWAGSDGFSFRRMILHYAHLCAAAGGVDRFLVGSELRGLTHSRDQAGSFPAVAHLASLVGAVRSILGPSTELSYGADWSEYFGYQPADGSGDVYFHLDPLWADDNVDFIGIDNYMPLADWRDGAGHADAVAGARSIYDLDYLQGNIAGGEGYDWFYANKENRSTQLRTPITDGNFGEPWVFRPKDLLNWWQNPHHDRPGGVRAAGASPWQPMSKPIVFTELGCGATDKGANQPNVFFDPKSFESGRPYFSTAKRDDLIQRRFIEAHMAYWAEVTNNPPSPIYQGQMVRADEIYIYTWDARPFPDFPAREDVWADGVNWQGGHWLTGRAGRVPLDLLVRALAQRGGLAQIDASLLEGLVTGYMLDRPMSARASLEPVAGLYQFDPVESGAQLRFVPRGGVTLVNLSRSDLVADEDFDYQLTRAQEADLPAAFDLVYTDEGHDYETAAVQARRPGARGLRRVALDTAVVLATGEAEGRAAALLNDALVMRDMAAFALPPSRLALEPGDVVTLDVADVAYDLRLTDILDGEDRRISAVRTARSLYDIQYGAARLRPGPAPAVYGPPVVALLDLPLLAQGLPVLHLAAFARPWPGGIALYTQQEGGTPQLQETLRNPALLGRLVQNLSAGPVGRLDKGNQLIVDLGSGGLQSVALADLLEGGNLAAVQSADGAWEVLSFGRAELRTDGRWLLTDLLRALAGTEEEAKLGAKVGARFVLLDAAVQTVPLTPDQRLVETNHLAGPQGELPGGRNFISRKDNFSGRGYRPLSPVHLAATAEPAGIALRWIRRTRLGGDNWESAEVPLGETAEIYEIDILDGAGIVLRQLTSTTESVLYPQSQIEQDFGVAGLGGSLQVAVAQVSAIAGRGQMAWGHLRF